MHNTVICTIYNHRLQILVIHTPLKTPGSEQLLLKLLANLFFWNFLKQFYHDWYLVLEWPTVFQKLIFFGCSNLRASPVHLSKVTGVVGHSNSILYESIQLESGHHGPIDSFLLTWLAPLGVAPLRSNAFLHLRSFYNQHKLVANSREICLFVRIDTTVIFALLHCSLSFSWF